MRLCACVQPLLPPAIVRNIFIQTHLGPCFRLALLASSVLLVESLHLLLASLFGLGKAAAALFLFLLALPTFLFVFSTFRIQSLLLLLLLLLLYLNAKLGTTLRLSLFLFVSFVKLDSLPFWRPPRLPQDSSQYQA